MRRPRPITDLAAIIVVALAMTACGGADEPAEPVGPDRPVTSDPDDDPEEPGEDPAEDPGDDVGADFDTETARQQARAVLGMAEGDLPEDVRIGRRGDETFMLTEDYVLGRRTVELDDDGDGFRVTSVIVELPDGPETFELEPS